MKKHILFIILLNSTSVFANVDNSLEQICSSQNGTMMSLSRGGTIEFLTDGNGITHQRFSRDDKVIDIDLNNVGDQVKKQIIDSIRFGYDLEMCVKSDGNISPMMARISTEHK